MSAVSALLRGRVLAESLMLDTCQITRISGQTTDGAGHITNTYTSVYVGKCKVQRQPNPTNPRSENVGEAQQWMGRLELHLPMATVGVASDDIVTITASTYDPDLGSRVFHLRALGSKTLATARRFGLEEVTS